MLLCVLINLGLHQVIKIHENCLLYGNHVTVESAIAVGNFWALQLHCSADALSLVLVHC